VSDRSLTVASPREVQKLSVKKCYKNEITRRRQLSVNVRAVVATQSRAELSRENETEFVIQNGRYRDLTHLASHSDLSELKPLDKILSSRLAWRRLVWRYAPGVSPPPRRMAPTGEPRPPLRRVQARRFHGGMCVGFMRCRRSWARYSPPSWCPARPPTPAISPPSSPSGECA
jgi:hypothetical protein